MGICLELNWFPLFSILSCVKCLFSLFFYFQFILGPFTRISSYLSSFCLFSIFCFCFFFLNGLSHPCVLYIDGSRPWTRHCGIGFRPAVWESSDVQGVIFMCKIVFQECMQLSLLPKNIDIKIEANITGFCPNRCYSY